MALPDHSRAAAPILSALRLQSRSVFTSGAGLLARLRHLFDDPRASAVWNGLLVGLLDDLNLHVFFLLMDEIAVSYLRGSGICSTTHAQPLWGRGFLSAFLTIWIFMVLSL
jgi:hypothetical protein